MGFTLIMRACLCISKDRKAFSSKVSIKRQWNSICFSSSKQYSPKDVNIQITWECHFSLFKNLSSAVISSWSFGNANSFSFLIEQYFIDTLESIVKVFQGSWNILFNPEIIFYHVHTLVWFLDNDWTH